MVKLIGEYRADNVNKAGLQLKITEAKMIIRKGEKVHDVNFVLC
jgi:hypothetical protein